MPGSSSPVLALPALGLGLALGLAACASTSGAGPSAGAAPDPAADPAPEPGPDALEARAAALARRLILVDGHIDLPYRLREGLGPDGAPSEDVTARTEAGDFDLVRAREGGLDAPFMSIYVPAALQKTPGAAKALADRLIDLVEGIARAAPDRATIATSPAAVRAAHAEGRLALLLGMENGAPIEEDLSRLDHFHRRGVRYITLTHSEDNAICDSSYDTRRTWGGVSPFGRQVIERMNALGILVDVSHLSDAATEQAVAASRAPVIASHSSVRALVPDFERNLSDPLIRRIAEGGGVVMINFGSGFLDAAYRAHGNLRYEAGKAFLAAEGIGREDPRYAEWRKAWEAEHPAPPKATVETVADHIDHVVKLVGVDHVGLGSDFDGVGDSLPTGLEDVSRYPNLLRVLLARGYSEAELAKIAGENLLRVWARAEAVARGE